MLLSQIKDAVQNYIFVAEMSHSVLLTFIQTSSVNFKPDETLRV